MEPSAAILVLIIFRITAIRTYANKLQAEPPFDSNFRTRRKARLRRESILYISSISLYTSTVYKSTTVTEQNYDIRDACSGITILLSINHVLNLL